MAVMFCRLWTTVKTFLDTRPERGRAGRLRPGDARAPRDRGRTVASAVAERLERPSTRSPSAAASSPPPRSRRSPSWATPARRCATSPQNSEFSHGVLHYYFRDKVDLITHCVREYKAQCVTRYDEVVATASSAVRARRRLPRQADRDARRGGGAAPALVRPAQPVDVRGVLPGRRRRDRPEPGADDLAGALPVRRARRRRRST